jgi:hypothetical protein
MAPLAIIAVVATVASAAMSAYSSMKQAKAMDRQAEQQQQAAATAMQIGEYNATLAEREGQQAREQAAYEADRSRERYDKLRGAQLAAAGHSGLQTSSGTPLLLLNETAENSALDEFSILYAGDLGAVNKSADAARDRFNAQVARNEALNRSASLKADASGARWSAASTLVGAVGKAASYGMGGTQAGAGAIGGATTLGGR